MKPLTMKQVKALLHVNQLIVQLITTYYIPNIDADAGDKPTAAGDEAIGIGDTNVAICGI